MRGWVRASDRRAALCRWKRVGVVPWQPRRPVKGGNKLRRDVRDTKAQRLAVFESLEAYRPNAVLHVLVESSVHGVEPLRHVLDAVELGRFSQSQQIAEALGALDARLKKAALR